MRAALVVITPLFGLLAGCVQPDLGFSPFLCNPGNPPCPEGYNCVQRGTQKRCEKEGAEPPAADQGLGPDAAVADSSPMTDWPQLPDHGRRDAPPVVADHPVVPLDLPPATEGFQIGCQSNTDCKQQDPNNPCCCPFMPPVYVCLPLCMNPICF